MLKQMREYAAEQEKLNYERVKNEGIQLREKQFRQSNKNMIYLSGQNSIKNLVNITNIFVSDQLQKYKDELLYELMQQEIKMKEHQVEPE